MGAILGNATNPKMKKPRLTKCGFFVFCFSGPLGFVFLGPGGHVGAILGNATNPKLKKPRLTKCGFFVFGLLRAFVYCFLAALGAMSEPS